MNIGTYNWHKRCFDITYLLFLILFQLLPRLLTSKHRKICSTYLVGRNGTKLKTCFSSSQNAKNQNQQIIKTKWVRDFHWQLGLRAWRTILLITWWAHKCQPFTIISIKKWEFENFLFTTNRVFKHTEVVSNLHVWGNGLGKM
jgi:hypothetical protein